MNIGSASNFANVNFRASHAPLPIPRAQTELPIVAAPSDGMPINQETTPKEDADELRDKFQDFVGQTFFSELIKSLRTAQQGASYFNGGRAEKVFQGQFDQMMSEHLSEASAKSISDPMFELFQLGRMSG